MYLPDSVCHLPYFLFINVKKLYNCIEKGCNYKNEREDNYKDREKKPRGENHPSHWSVKEVTMSYFEEIWMIASLQSSAFQAESCFKTSNSYANKTDVSLSIYSLPACSSGLRKFWTSHLILWKIDGLKEIELNSLVKLPFCASSRKIPSLECGVIK